MSLLQLNDQATTSAKSRDASAAGEDYAKGSSYLIWTVLAAFVLVSVGITLFVLANHKPPVAAGEVTQVWAHAVHTINTPIDAAGVQSAGELFDQILVFASVRIRNQSDQPIVLKELLSNVTLEDGVHSSYAATATDYGRIFVAYPELKGLRGKSLVRDEVIEPGQVADGMIVSAFHVDKEQWAARKDLSFTVQLKFHPDLTLVPTGPITEQ